MVDKMDHSDRRERLAKQRVEARKQTLRVRDQPLDPCIRAENEDDDGYDPYSDRRPAPEPLFEEDPWG